MWFPTSAKWAHVSTLCFSSCSDACMWWYVVHILHHSRPMQTFFGHFRHFIRGKTQMKRERDSLVSASRTCSSLAIVCVFLHSVLSSLSTSACIVWHSVVFFSWSAVLVCLPPWPLVILWLILFSPTRFFWLKKSTSICPHLPFQVMSSSNLLGVVLGNKAQSKLKYVICSSSRRIERSSICKWT